MDNVIETFLRNNQAYARDFNSGDLPPQPARGVAVLTCMDARIDVGRILGLKEGDAHVIRNAGGVVTDDALRSLIVSQRYLDTNKIVVINHTNCGMLTFKDHELKDDLERETGVRPEFPIFTFEDLEANVKDQVAQLNDSPFIAAGTEVAGFIYDIETGRLQEVVR